MFDRNTNFLRISLCHLFTKAVNNNTTDKANKVNNNTKVTNYVLEEVFLTLLPLIQEANQINYEGPTWEANILT
jgi:hypothetical protein